ncbi:MAG: 4Fe-4S ferredoxin [Ignavibacteriales bacterium CG18_big_fil_WC_8_21_14_2_50_31_20]|nr:MAG: 4Fe-4S ferredoxin [Ignavibacteriales bacterium CG18_big_fil_WC_8_21_14_2_50_31_20]
MEVFVENLFTYFFVALLFFLVLYNYLRKQKSDSQIVDEKIKKAKELGIYEPVSLHPVVDVNSCIQSGACITACPEKDILGIRNGKAVTINASRCVGHSACFSACPVDAISLHIGTEKRGVDLPHVTPNFESNVEGIYIAGEMGGMGLIKNAVEQGKQAVQNLTKSIKNNVETNYDLIIVGSGPAGISASLQAKKNNLKFLTLDQDSLGGTVYSFPRAKIVMTSPMDLPLFGKLKLFETSKTELLEIWEKVLSTNNIKVNLGEKVEEITKLNNIFTVETSKGNYTSKKVLLAIGRRGTPRKLGIPGEEKEKVAYRLLEPELIKNQKVIVVGGGDSAIESAILLSHEGNEVTLSYRKDSFSRIKPQNFENITKAKENNSVKIILNSNLIEIMEDSVKIEIDGNSKIIENNLVYIFAGGELPTQFLNKVGIKISTKYGEAILQKQ